MKTWHVIGLVAILLVGVALLAERQRMPKWMHVGPSYEGDLPMD